MGTVTQYNLQNVQDALGGAHPISMSEYYRGGAYVPTTRTVSEGPFYNNTGNGPGNYYWLVRTNIPRRSEGLWNTDTSQKYWAPVFYLANDTTTTSYTVGGYTYLRGAYVTGINGGLYQISRTSIANINTGVPASGAISLNQLLGAENP